MLDPKHYLLKMAKHRLADHYSARIVMESLDEAMEIAAACAALIIGSEIAVYMGSGSQKLPKDTDHVSASPGTADPTAVLNSTSSDAETGSAFDRLLASTDKMIAGEIKSIDRRTVTKADGTSVSCIEYIIEGDYKTFEYRKNTNELRTVL